MVWIPEQLRKVMVGFQSSSGKLGLYSRAAPESDGVDSRAAPESDGVDSRTAPERCVVGSEAAQETHKSNYNHVKSYKFVTIFCSLFCIY